MGVARESDLEQFLFDRLGPLSRAAIRNSPRILNIAVVLQKFANQRQPIFKDGDFYPRPPYNSPEGDQELAEFIENILKRYEPHLTSQEATLIGVPGVATRLVTRLDPGYKRNRTRDT